MKLRDTDVLRARGRDPHVLGMNESFNAAQAYRLAWGHFLSLQFFRIGGMVLPFALYDHIPGPDASPSLPVVLLGIAMTGACVVCVVRATMSRSLADVLLTERLEDDVGLITPYNRRVFLYNRRARELADKVGMP